MNPGRSRWPRGSVPTAEWLHGFAQSAIKTLILYFFLVIPTWVAAAEPVNRQILGLYDGTQEKGADRTRLHRLLEMPLNHLGYSLSLRDVSQSLPSPLDVQRYHAIATWFSGTLPNAAAYLDWATQVARTGTKFVVIDSVGALGEKHELPAINAFLDELGLRYAHYFVSDTTHTRIEATNAAILDFEQKLDPRHLPGHQVIIPVSDAISKHLSLRDPAYKWASAAESVVVSTGPRGGLIASGYSISYDVGNNRVRWIVNPFAFLEAALGRGHWPIPDTTTVSGRRLYFSHIDGDGWLNLLTRNQPAPKNVLASDIALEKFIIPYPDLPVTVGLIAGDIYSSHGGSIDAGLTALRYFSLPQVEMASHTFTHPYRWSFFETYDREKEIDWIERYVSENSASASPSLVRLLDELRANRSHAARETRTANPEHPSIGTLPRARPHLPFNLVTEIGEAIFATNKLAPPGKSTKLYLWSGDTRPFEAALVQLRLRGVANMNGGDSRFDDEYPSIAYVAPLSRQVGAERQIYAVNSNENTYTNGWRGPFDGFKALTQTLANTEHPRRLKGFNLYYHIYSASRPDSTDVVISHLEAARAGHLTPIAASHYAGIVEGFFTARISAISPNRWLITDRGDLDTVRFDNAAALDVDYNLSSGVIGHRRLNDVLYVHLDPDDRNPRISLSPASKAGRYNKFRRVHLKESRWRLSNISRAPCLVQATAQGFGIGEMSWVGLNVGKYSVTTIRKGNLLTERSVSVGKNGDLELSLQDDAIQPLQLRIACIASKTSERRISRLTRPNAEKSQNRVASPPAPQ